MVQELKKKITLYYFDVSKTPERLWKKISVGLYGMFVCFLRCDSEGVRDGLLLRTINLILTVPRSEDKAPIMFLLKLNILKTDWPFDPFG